MKKLCSSCWKNSPHELPELTVDDVAEALLSDQDNMENSSAVLHERLRSSLHLKNTQAVDIIADRMFSGANDVLKVVASLFVKEDGETIRSTLPLKARICSCLAATSLARMQFLSNINACAVFCTFPVVVAVRQFK